LKFVGAAKLGTAVLISGPAVAQQSGTQSAQTQTAQADNASGLVRPTRPHRPRRAPP